MAEVTDVKSSKPIVESFTLKLAPWEARDMVTFIEYWYEKYGYGKTKATSSELHKALKAGLAGNTTIPSPF